MNNNFEPPPPPSIGLDDVVYLFFRHKWKIIFFTLVGAAIAANIILSEKKEYRSQAKLLIRYITEKKNILTDPTSKEGDSARPLDPREASIIAAEAEILRSFDSIVTAVATVTPSKVLEAYGGGTNLLAAAEIIGKNFQVDLAKGSPVMLLTLSHRDQDVAQRLLLEIISEYRKKHLQIHNSGATKEQLTIQTEEIKNRLAKTETDLQVLKKSVSVHNLEQSKTAFAKQLTDLQSLIFQTESELGELHASLRERQASNPAENPPAEGDKEKTTFEVPSATVIAKFNQLNRKLASLREHEAELLNVYTDSSKKVTQIRADITETEEQINNLPIDKNFIAAQAANRANGVSSPGFDWSDAKALFAATVARYQIQTNQLAQVRKQSAKLDAVENEIAQLERKKKMEEEEFAYYQKNLEEATLEQTIDANRRNNISVIQNPSRLPPERTTLIKKAAAASGAGIAFGVLLAFLIDYVFNPSVKRTKDLETSMRLPVIAAIPDFGRKLKAKRKDKKALLASPNGHLVTNGEIAPWEEKDPMLPYYEALRDRIVMSYNGDLHKPKIVGLTSCNAGAGVSRLATGLAASLSRDAQRNVLLVGLQRNKVAVSAFAKGRPVEESDQSNGEHSSEQSLVAQNLHSLATTGHNLQGASVVQSFSELLPKLKICEYDFIIFDLPPLTQTSGTLRLASQMERTVLVVEAEETAKAKIKKARDLLKGNQVFAILNKSHTYGPKSLNEVL